MVPALYEGVRLNSAKFISFSAGICTDSPYNAAGFLLVAVGALLLCAATLCGVRCLLPALTLFSRSNHAGMPIELTR